MTATAALVAGLATGFAADSGQSPLRTVGYGLGGGAIGLVAVTISLGYVFRGANERARGLLHEFGQRCR